MSRHNRKSFSGSVGNFSILSQITDRTGEQFLEEILKIHENQYTPINHIPTIFGRRINLLALYNAVAKRGGYKRMNTELSWEGVLADLKMPIKCANASVALKSIFQRYLEPYERIQRNKSLINEIEEELQLESETRYKTSAQRITLSHGNFNPISMVYKAENHLIQSHKRQEFGLSYDLNEAVEFQKLEMSLKSGLVNEIEFSLNSILLMSFQIDGVQLFRNPRLLDLMLRTIGIADLVTLNDLSLNDGSSRRFLQFWNDNIKLYEGRKFLHPDIFTTDDGVSAPELTTLTRMFTLCDQLTVYDLEGQRIQLVVTILRNLVLQSTNSQLITQSHQSMRLIVLCCYSSHYALRHLGLEILSMLSFPVVGILQETVKHVLDDLICGEDRVDRLRGLELLAHLSDQKVCLENIEFLGDLPKQVFSSLISMLIIHDLHIVVLALEAVYRLSEIDPHLCTKLVDCSPETLPTLYILLSLEAQVMGTQSLIRIRVMQGPGSTINQISTNRFKVHHTQSNPSSLMPPPPVPIHKTTITAVSSPNACSIKPPVHFTTEVSSTQIRPHITQKVYPVVTDIVYPTSQTNIQVPVMRSPIVKSELLTTSSVPVIESYNTSTTKSSHIVQSIISASPVRENLQPQAQELSVPHVVVTTSPNHIYCNNHSNISTIPSQKPARSGTEAMKQLELSTPRDNNTQNLNIIHHNLIPKEFTNKQDFVKSWLLNNYTESLHCTVPLFAMYKRLQIAVQNYFKDSEMVTAEEFHKLVRILFPQVQLVQLQITDDTVEIHYYNLSMSSLITLKEVSFESHASKSKELITNSRDLPLINGAQGKNKISSDAIDDLNQKKKILKRHCIDMVNGHCIEDDYSEQCPKKRYKSGSECDVITSVCESNNQTISPTAKESNMNNIQLNGMVHQSSNNVDTNCNHTPQFPDRYGQLHSNGQTNQLSNGSLLDEIKQSDTEMKAFSSSTVSPIHCESLANGTDVSSEGTTDSDLGKLFANIKSATPIATRVPTSTHVSSITADPNSTATSTSDTNSTSRNAKKSNCNLLGRTRSRFRNTGTVSKCKQRSSSSLRPLNLSYLYICEWDNCLQSFDKPQKVYGHVYTNHFMTLRTEVESICLWATCDDKTHRTPLPLLNHVNDNHCNNIALESARQIRLAKEKEKSIAEIKEETVIKSEDNVTAEKLLNFYPVPSTVVPEPLSSVSASTYQCSAIQTPVQICNVPVPVISTCASLDASVASSSLDTTVTNTPISSISVPSSVSLTQTQSSTNIQTINTTTATVHQNINPLSCTNVPNDTSSSELAVSHTVTSDLGATTLVSNTSTNHSSNAPCPTLSLMIHPTKEGPVTKHIRFLSALILRNLCQWSSQARRFVAARHQQIFEMSISGCESSRALSECLFYSNIDAIDNSRPKK